MSFEQRYLPERNVSPFLHSTQRLFFFFILFNVKIGVRGFLMCRSADGVGEVELDCLS